MASFWKTTEVSVGIATSFAIIGNEVEEFVENSSIPILGKGAAATAPIQVKAANLVVGLAIAAVSYWVGMDIVSDAGVGFGGGYGLSTFL